MHSVDCQIGIIVQHIRIADLFDDVPGGDVDLGVEDHHHDQRQVKGADGRVQLPPYNSLIKN